MNKSDLKANQDAFLNLSNKKQPKAIVFDWDNTLVDTWPLIRISIDKTMKEMGKEEWGLEKVRDNVHKSMRESFPEIFGDKWESAGEIYKNSYRNIHLDKLRFLENSLNLIKKLKEKNILQFIVSNKIGNTLRKETEKLQVQDYFFAIIGAQDASDDKPSKAPVEMALLGSDLDPRKDEIWFIGDTVADIECAYNAGLQPIIFGHPTHLVSKTIPKDYIKNGKNNEGPLPLYFNHQELINLL